MICPGINLEPVGPIQRGQVESLAKGCISCIASEDHERLAEIVVAQSRRGKRRADDKIIDPIIIDVTGGRNAGAQISGAVIRRG